MSFSKRIPLSRLKGLITSNISARWSRLVYLLILFAIVLSSFHYRIKSRAEAGNLAVSGSFSFTNSTQDTTPPTVTSVSPAAGATNVNANANVTVTFSEPMDAASVNNSTIVLRKSSGAPVAATISYNPALLAATLDPTASLMPGVTYTLLVRGGGTNPRVKDAAGNALTADVTWTFTIRSCPCSVWGSAVNPTAVMEDPGNSIELGMKFRSDLNGLITGVRFYKGGAANSGPHVGNLWTSSGTLLGSVTFTNETAMGWQQASFTTPIPITANTTYVVSYFAPQGNYIGEDNFFASSGVDNAPLHALKDGIEGGNGVYLYTSTSSFPTNTYESENYWVDVMFITPPPTVVSFTPAAGATNLPLNTAVGVTFNEDLNSTTVNGSTVELLNSSNAVVPATVSYSTGTGFNVFLFPTGPLAPGMTYTMRVRGGSTDPRIKDLEGNALAADVIWTFTTSADGTPPTVVSFNPMAGATQVNTNANVTVTFSEAMDPGTVYGSTVELRDPSNALVPKTVSYNAASLTATLDPAASLSAGTTYTARVKGGSIDPRVKDVAGNALAADVTWTFTTQGVPANLSMALIDPMNRVGSSPGEDLLSRNYNWSLPLLSLQGRAGLDLGLALSLNSLIYTRAGSVMHFDPDQGYPAPGFSMGFPEIRNAFINTDANTPSYLLTMPSGRRVEFRQTSTNIYDAVDSSYMRLTHDTINSVFILYTTDGTQCRFMDVTGSGDYKCVQIKDRNGNYITITYGSLAEIRTVTDTLGRLINFNYDTFNHLLSITQNWGGTTHTWATFAYGTQTIQTNFQGLTLNGTTNGTQESVLTRVGLADGSIYSFEYNTYAQVKTIRRYAPNDSNPVNFPGDYFQRAYTTYGLPDNAISSQTDCPRITSRTDWDFDWNNSNTVTSTYLPDSSFASGEVTFPDGTRYKEFFATAGWQRGLTTQTENWAGPVRKKWTSLQWTQDNTGVAYRLNPRVTETTINDEVGNRRRMSMSYTSFGLVSDVSEYDADTTTVLRRTHTVYNLNAVYTNRRIIGLPSERFLYDGNGTLFSKVTYEYDQPANPYLEHQGPPVQHDTANYGAGFVQGRGNLNRMRRWDVTDPNNASLAYETGYNTSGSVIFTRDPLNHETTISYTDSFSDLQNNRNTYAYPTTVTVFDPDAISSTVQYNYDFGAVTRTQDPKGAAATRTYDAAGRLNRVTNEVNGAYTQYAHSPNQQFLHSFTTVNDFSESQQITGFDGHDRVRVTVSDHPTSVGQYKAQFNSYDVMGRLVGQTNPTEIDSLWQPAGDDAAAGWVGTTQAYDWQGRPTVSTNQDWTTRSISYEGCGCAGGQKIVLTDEMGRRREQNFDVLGRIWRERTYNWGGANDTGVYTTTINTYNIRDQVTNINVTDIATGAAQNTVMNYDGHGRLKEKWLPIFQGNPQSATPYMSYEYYDDDMLKKVTDPRGASSTQVYNNRHLVTSVTYGVPSGVAATPNVSFAYDEAGNRTMMDDGPGIVTYNYDTLSRLINETRVFDSISRYKFQGSGQSYQNTFSIGYQYNLAGGLRQIQTPTGDSIDYSYDKAGTVTSISGTPRDGVTDYITDIKYRAWGAAKRVSFGYANYSIDAQFNGRMLISRIDDQSQFGVTYNYNQSGQVNTIQGIYARAVDRSFNYDHVGRVLQNRSASAAGLGSSNLEQLKQDYSHDAFNHMTSRSGRYWYTSQSSNSVFSASYVNDRATNVTDGGVAQNWQYDVAGNIKSFFNNSTGWIESSDWDAARRPAKRSWIGTIGGEVGSWTDFEYDGNGSLVSETPTSPPGINKPFTEGTASYYVTSSVLSKTLLSVSVSWVLINGQYVIRQEQLLNGQLRDLTEKKLSIYVGGEEVATRIYEAYVFQNSSRVIWQHRDPHNTIARIGNASDHPIYSVDTLGVLVRVASDDEINAFWTPPSGGDPIPPQGFYSDQSGQSSSYGYSTPSPGNWGLGCYVDKVQMPCERARRFLASGSGTVDEVNTPTGSVQIPGLTVWEKFKSHSTDRPDGWDDGKYVGGGDIVGSTEYEVIGSLFSPAQGGNTLGSLQAKLGTWITNDFSRTNKFKDAFKTIQTKSCQDYVDSLIQRMAPHNLHGKPAVTFVDLLKTVTFSLYNPNETGVGAPWKAGNNGYSMLQNDVSSIGQNLGEAQAGLTGMNSNNALTINKNTYISSYRLGAADLNAGVLIVHEILHAAGISTKSAFWSIMPFPAPVPGGILPIPMYSPPWDPLVDLDPEIKKHCAPNLPGV